MDLKHRIRTNIPEVRSCGLVGGGWSGEGRGSELCSSLDGEPWLVRIYPRCKAVGRKAKREPRMRAVGLDRTKKRSLWSKWWGSSLTVPATFSLQNMEKERASDELGGRGRKD